MPKKGSGQQREKRIIEICDGTKSSKEIAEILKENPKYVQRIMKKYDLPRLSQGAQPGENNSSYKCGRRIDYCGYALVSAPLNHPYCRNRKDRNYGVIAEHRLVMEKKLGRYLLPEEVVDHIDGITLHNHPDNLRLFSCNGQHLKKTLKNRIPKWSEAGQKKLSLKKKPRKIGRFVLKRKSVNTFQKKKKSGDARLIQILRALLKFGIDSPYLVGTHHHLEKAGISDFSRPNLKHELEKLYQKYA